MAGAHAFEAPSPRNAVAFTLITASGFGQSLFNMFYGFGPVLLGWLIFRSGFIPRAFGALLVLTGIVFTVRTLLVVLAPAYASPMLLIVAAIAFPPLSLWLLVKGVDVAKWRERATLHRGHQ